MSHATIDHANKKHTMRQAARQRRAALTEDQRRSHAEAFARHFLEAVTVKDHIVAGYWATQGELDVMPLLHILAQQGHICCLPAMIPTSRQLAFRRWQPGATIEPGGFGIIEPTAENEALVPDTIIVPLVAFDAARHRIGYGAGYYDCTLDTLRRSGRHFTTVGAAYGIQQVKSVPAEPHDEVLDMIITENGVLKG